MTRQSILLVSSAFYPEISPRSFRATELAKEFARQGHEVIVMSKYRSYNYANFLKEFPITIKMWRKQIWPVFPGFNIRWLSILSRIFNRFLSLVFEYPNIEGMFRVRNILKGEKGYDLMISFAVPFPVHWGVSWARTEKNPIAKIWIADCGDPYMFARLDSFKKPFYFKIPEVNFCHKCDYISVPFDQMRNQFYPEFRSKIEVIPQGINFNEVVVSKENPKNEKPVFVFAGSIIPGKRDLTLFLDFLSSISTDFLFIVYTNQNFWFKKYKLTLNEKLVLNEYIDRLPLIYEISKADFLVNVDTIFDTQSEVEAVPSKLIDYALARRPILNLIHSFLDKGMVMEFLNGDYSRQRVVNLLNHDISKVALKFLELVNRETK